MQKNKKIVVLGGGTGTSTLLSGLKYFPVDITAIITVSDNGSSTGRLRKEFSIPAVGDIRKVLSSLSTLPDEVRDVMEYRLSSSPTSELDGHAIGNLLLTSLIKETGSLKKSIEYLSKILDVKQKVLPLSEDYLTLMGETEEGEIVEGEEQITKARKKYKRLFYDDNPHVLPEVLTAISQADLIIFSIGSLYTSVLPHLICNEVVETINKARNEKKAKLCYICNAMTQPGETDNFGVCDHVNALEKYLGEDTIDLVIASNTKLKKSVLLKYSDEEQKDQVRIDYENMTNKNFELIEDDLLITPNNTIRHNSMKLSSIIFSYLMR